jgi:hypothetical protein
MAKRSSGVRSSPRSTYGPTGESATATRSEWPDVVLAAGVVHPPAAVVLGHLGRPAVAAHADRRLERAAQRAPADQVVGDQHLEHRAVLGDGAGADGDVAAA